MTATLDEIRFRPGEGENQRIQKLELLRRHAVARRLNLSIAGLPDADSNEPLVRMRIQDTSWTFSGGAADAGDAATGTPALRLRKNGVSAGTITFSGTTGTVSFTQTAFAQGDLFEIYPPTAADPTLDQVSISLTVSIV